MNHDAAVVSRKPNGAMDGQIDTGSKPVVAFWLIKQANFHGFLNAKYENPWHPQLKELSPTLSKLWTKMSLKDEDGTAEPIRLFISNLFWNTRREVNQAWKLKFDLKDTTCLPTYLKDMVEFYLRDRLPTMTHEAMKAFEKSRRAAWKSDPKKWAKEIESWETERNRWSNMIKLACEKQGDQLSTEDLQEVKYLVDQIREILLGLKKQLDCMKIAEIKRVPKAKKGHQTDAPIEQSATSKIEPSPGFDAKVDDFPKLGNSAPTTTPAPAVTAEVIQIENQQAPTQVSQQMLPIPQLAPLQRLATVDPNIFLWLDDQGRILMQTIQGMIVIRQIVNQQAPAQVSQQMWPIPQLAPLQRLATVDPNIFLWLDDQGRILMQTIQGMIVIRQIVL
jgi:hypothetical protein